MQVGIDTYITVEQADDVIKNNVYSQSKQRKAWDSLSEEDKAVFLAQAMIEIESLVYLGVKADQSQLLQFPRKGQEDVPSQIQAAQALEACAIVIGVDDENMRSQLRAQGITSFSLGSLSETYDTSIKDTSMSVNKLKSVAAKQLLSPFLSGGFPLV